MLHIPSPRLLFCLCFSWEERGKPASFPLSHTGQVTWCHTNYDRARNQLRASQNPDKLAPNTSFHDNTHYTIDPKPELGAKLWNTKKRGGKSSMSLHSSFHLPTEPHPFPTPGTPGTQAHEERVLHHSPDLHSRCCWEHLKAEKKHWQSLLHPFSLTKFLKTESKNVPNLLPCISNTNKSTRNAPKRRESPSLCLPLTEKKGRQGTKQTHMLKGVNSDIGNWCNWWYLFWQLLEGGDKKSRSHSHRKCQCFPKFNDLIFFSQRPYENAAGKNHTGQLRE